MPSPTAYNSEQIIRDISRTQPWRDPAWVGKIAFGSCFSIKPGTGNLSPSLHIWEMPHSMGAYTVALDPSLTGERHGDPAAVQVLWGRTQVAECLFPPINFSDQVAAAVWLADFYNEATLVIESSGLPEFMMEQAERSGYANLWGDGNRSTGLKMSAKTRGAWLDFLIDLSRTGEPLLRSKRLQAELFGSVYEGDRTSHDLTDAYLVAIVSQVSDRLTGSRR